MRKILLLVLLSFVMLGAVGDVSKGYSTWYDETWREIPMASGLMFDRNRLEAAHRRLNFGTVVKVTSKRTGQSVIVVITDRGPCAHVNTTVPLSYRGCPEPPEGKAINKSRIIDLTPVAAEAIGMLILEPGQKPKEISGVTKVTVEILKPGTCRSWGSCKKKPFKRGKTVE